MKPLITVWSHDLTYSSSSDLTHRVTSASTHSLRSQPSAASRCSLTIAPCSRRRSHILFPVFSSAGQRCRWTGEQRWDSRHIHMFDCCSMLSSMLVVTRAQRAPEKKMSAQNAKSSAFDGKPKLTKTLKVGEAIAVSQKSKSSGPARNPTPGLSHRSIAAGVIGDTPPPSLLPLYCHCHRSRYVVPTVARFAAAIPGAVPPHAACHSPPPVSARRFSHNPLTILSLAVSLAAVVPHWTPPILLRCVVSPGGRPQHFLQ
jgi:hypothetical protein